MNKTTKLLLILGVAGVGVFLFMSSRSPLRMPGATAGRVPTGTPPRGNSEANVWGFLSSGATAIGKALSGRGSGGGGAAGGGQVGTYDVTDAPVGDLDVVGNELIDDTGSAAEYGPW